MCPLAGKYDFPRNWKAGVLPSQLYEGKVLSSGQQLLLRGQPGAGWVLAKVWTWWHSQTYSSTGSWGKAYVGFSYAFCKTPALSWSYLSWVFNSSCPAISRWHSAGQRLWFFCPWVLAEKEVGGGTVNTPHNLLCSGWDGKMGIACSCFEMSLTVGAAPLGLSCDPAQKSRALPLLCHWAVGCSQVLGLPCAISSRDVMKALIPPIRRMLL